MTKKLIQKLSERLMFWRIIGANIPQESEVPVETSETTLTVLDAIDQHCENLMRDHMGYYISLRFCSVTNQVHRTKVLHHRLKPSPSPSTQNPPPQPTPSFWDHRCSPLAAYPQRGQHFLLFGPASRVFLHLGQEGGYLKGVQRSSFAVAYGLL